MSILGNMEGAVSFLKELKVSIMYQQQKFARAAQRRKYLSLTAAILLHLAVFAAIANPDALKEWLPDFLIELVQGENATVEELPRP